MVGRAEAVAAEVAVSGEGRLAVASAEEASAEASEGVGAAAVVA